MALFLFDIDGTLVRTGGAGKEAMEFALRQSFDLVDLIDTVPYAGRTDPAITHDLLVAHGIAPTEANLRTLQDAYLANLEPALTRLGGEVCPGIAELLPLLAAQPGVTLGLLTGNMRRGAERKLGHFDLWKYFPLGGGFGDVHADRNHVARAAYDAFVPHRTGLTPTDVWVVGDTPLDVACARAIGANAIAVATGWHTLDELHATGADYVVPTLPDVAGLLRWAGL